MSNGEKGIWKTVAEVKRDDGLKEGVIYNWSEALQFFGLARRNPGKRHGLILLSPKAIRYIEYRSKRKGNPKFYEEDWGDYPDKLRRRVALAQWLGAAYVPTEEELEEELNKETVDSR